MLHITDFILFVITATVLWVCRYVSKYYVDIFIKLKNVLKYGKTFEEATQMKCPQVTEFSVTSFLAASLM